MKTKKRIFSILLTLALVLGLMPGMSNTAYAIYEPNGLDHFNSHAGAAPAWELK